MPPIGINGLPPQGLPTPQSVGSEAAGAAGQILDAANQQRPNVPASTEGLSPTSPAVPPAEEAIPTSLMGGSQPPVRVPVQNPSPMPAAPTPAEAADGSSFGAFAPKPSENPYAQTPPPTATPTEQADQRVSPPEPDWQAMATSTKAGAEQPSSTAKESPAQSTYGELGQDNLDKEAASPEALAIIEGLSQDPAAVLAAAQEISRDPNSDSRRRRLTPWRPFLAKIVDSIPKK